MKVYENLQGELGLSKLKEQTEGSILQKKEKDGGKKKGFKKDHSKESIFEESVEDIAERIGIHEIVEMNKKEEYIRPEFFSWASNH